MVRIGESKELGARHPIDKPPLPQSVYIPLLQHAGTPCAALVKPGDKVTAGQKIGSAEAHVFAPVHASVSGRVAGIVNWPHPAAGRGPAVVIDSDGSDNVSRIPNPAPPDSLTPAQLRSLIFEAGITGMGGAGFPAHIKLNPPRPVDALIINGAECEQYLTAD